MISSTTPTVGSATVYAGNESPTAIPSSTARHLWMMLNMPLYTSTTDQQLLNVNVTASSP